MSLNEKKAGFNWFGSVTAHEARRPIFSPALGRAMEAVTGAISFSASGASVATLAAIVEGAEFQLTAVGGLEVGLQPWARLRSE